MGNTDLKYEIKSKAEQLGFDLVGICKPHYSPEDHNHLLCWLNRGYHGQMTYMARKPRQRSDPELFMEDVRSVVAVGINYFSDTGYSPDKPYVSIYARGSPYQKVVKDKLKALLKYIKSVQPGTKGKIAVDTSPTFDKLWAQEAGLGWRGKNTLFLNREMGSFVFLGELFLNIEIEPDNPEIDHCGDCNKCLESCPTGALEKPHLLNATKCISYLTIELTDSPQNPEHDNSNSQIGNHLFGCDICQIVCPYNKSPVKTNNAEFIANQGFDDMDTDKLSDLTESEFEHRFKGTLLGEYGFNRFKRNLEAVKINLENH
jgi:epoxyqueuosine reductase